MIYRDHKFCITLLWPLFLRSNLWKMSFTFVLNSSAFCFSWPHCLYFTFKLTPNWIFSLHFKLLKVFFKKENKVKIYKIQYYPLKSKYCPELELPWQRFAICLFAYSQVKETFEELYSSNIFKNHLTRVLQIATNRRMTVKYNPPSSCILEISVKGIKLSVQEDYYACDRVRHLLILCMSTVK